MKWRIEPLHLELKYTWKISRNSSDFKVNLIVIASDGEHEAMGEVAPNIRYGETPETITAAFAQFLSGDAEEVSSLPALTALLNRLQLPNALRFGIESAFVHLLCLKKQVSLFDLLAIDHPGRVKTNFSLPIMETGSIGDFYNENKLDRFGRIKIKVNSDTMVEDIHALSKVCKRPIIVDANEAWEEPDALLMAMERLRPYSIDFIEQPMPAALEEEYKYLKRLSPYLLMADESILAEPVFESLKEQFHGINMKLMKAGGYLNGIRILKEAQEAGLRTMIGCMVETTLGIYSAWSLCAYGDYADLDGFLILKEEPFGMLREENGVLYDR